MFAVALAAVGCSAQNSAESFRKALEDYDQSVGVVVEATVGIADAVPLLQQHLASDDQPGADAAADSLASAADQLLAGVAEMERLENRLQGDDPPREGMITQRLVLEIGVGLVVWGLYSFGKKMRSLCDDMTEERQKRDDAAERMANGDPTAEQDYKAAKSNMTAIGGEAVKELGSKVTTELVLAPVKPITVGGVILKEAAGNLLQQGLKIISTTKSCGSDPTASDCRIAIQRTGSKSRATVPAGKQTLLISTQGKARIAIAEVTVVEGQDTEVKRELIAIDEATPQAIAANDAGEYRPPDPEVRGSKACVPQCSGDSDCPPDITCVAGACSLPVPAAHQACLSDIECPSPALPRCGGRQVDQEGNLQVGWCRQCVVDSDCPKVNPKCSEAGKCYGGCTVTADCPAGHVCR